MITFLIDEAAQAMGVTEHERIATTRDFFLIGEWLDEEKDYTVVIRSDLLDRITYLSGLFPDLEMRVVDKFDNVEFPISTAVRNVARMISGDDFILEEKERNSRSKRDVEEEGGTDEPLSDPT